MAVGYLFSRITVTIYKVLSDAAATLQMIRQTARNLALIGCRLLRSSWVCSLSKKTQYAQVNILIESGSAFSVTHMPKYSSSKNNFNDMSTRVFYERVTKQQ